MPSAVEFADWLVCYCSEAVGAPIDPMSLEKHLFYAQSFYLALAGRPLFDDDFQAWTHGPVVPDVWNRYSGAMPIEIPRQEPKLFPQDTQNYLADTVALFGGLSRFELSNATHLEDPWLNSRQGLPTLARSNRVIPKNDMANYYLGLISQGEEALSNYALLGGVPQPRWGWLYIAGICSRQMASHPFFTKALSVWGKKLWERPRDEEIPEAEYPAPPSEPRSRAEIKVESSEEFRAEYRCMMS